MWDTWKLCCMDLRILSLDYPITIQETEIAVKKLKTRELMAC